MAGCGCCGGGSPPAAPVILIGGDSGAPGSPLPGTQATTTITTNNGGPTSGGAGNPLPGTQAPTGAALAPAATTTPGTSALAGSEPAAVKASCKPCLFLFLLFILALSTRGE